MSATLAAIELSPVVLSGKCASLVLSAIQSCACLGLSTSSSASVLQNLEKWTGRRHESTQEAKSDEWAFVGYDGKSYGVVTKAMMVAFWKKKKLLSQVFVYHAVEGRKGGQQLHRFQKQWKGVCLITNVFEAYRNVHVALVQLVTPCLAAHWTPVANALSDSYGDIQCMPSYGLLLAAVVQRCMCFVQRMVSCLQAWQYKRLMQTQPSTSCRS